MTVEVFSLTPLVGTEIDRLRTEVERLTTFLRRAGFDVCDSCNGQCGYANGGVCGDCMGDGIKEVAELPEDGEL